MCVEESICLFPVLNLVVCLLNLTIISCCHGLILGGFWIFCCSFIEFFYISVNDVSCCWKFSEDIWIAFWFVLLWLNTLAGVTSVGMMFWNKLVEGKQLAKQRGKRGKLNIQSGKLRRDNLVCPVLGKLECTW